MKKSLYIAGICAALSVGALGCASSAKAGDEETKPVVEDTEAAGEGEPGSQLFWMVSPERTEFVRILCT